MAKWRASEPTSAAVTVPERPTGETAAAVEPQWEDLSVRRAGTMAREQAAALKDAAPVRALLARMFGVHTEERAWRIGADGEEKVAVRLAKLAQKDGRWRYLHAIPIGRTAPTSTTL